MTWQKDIQGKPKNEYVCLDCPCLYRRTVNGKQYENLCTIYGRGRRREFNCIFKQGEELDIILFGRVNE